MAAVMRVLESWLFFQKGDAKQALEILQAAEAILSKTDDYLTLGNIHSSYGRIARRQGRYQHAIESFTTAIALYRKRDPQHRNVARSLNNMAYVKRLIALQLRRKIDAEAARRRKAATRGGAQQRQEQAVTIAVVLNNCARKRLAELGEAAAIYEQYGNHHGLGSVHLNYGFLHLDNGDLEHAEAEAKTAFHLAEERRDHILMARSRLLRCMIENARVEEGIGESTEPGGHARLAQDYVQEAIELAKHTENRRLLAHAYVWQGLTYCNRFFDDSESARRLLRPGPDPFERRPRRERMGRSANPEGPSSARRQGQPYAACLVARFGWRQNVPADHRGIRRTHHSQSLGARRAGRFRAWRLASLFLPKRFGPILSRVGRRKPPTE